ncbi:conserved domain protein [Enterococcus faecalis TX1467]|nr:conserved domain protein [Enterococcus faecalis TX1467]
MNQQQKELWVATIESSNLTGEITKDTINELGLILGGQPQLAQNIYQSFVIKPQVMNINQELARLFILVLITKRKESLLLG